MTDVFLSEKFEWLEINIGVHGDLFFSEQEDCGQQGHEQCCSNDSKSNGIKFNSRSHQRENKGIRRHDYARMRAPYRRNMNELIINQRSTPEKSRKNNNEKG